MSSRRFPFHLSDVLRRVVAVLCAGLVLALAVFAVSPGAHHWLHDDEDSAAAEAVEHSCAVVLFASGVAWDASPAALTPPWTAVGGVSPVTAADVYLVTPRYLRQPERGPPARLS